METSSLAYENIFRFSLKAANKSKLFSAFQTTAFLLLYYSACKKKLQQWYVYHPSEAVLYSKQTGGYSLSLQAKEVVVAYLRAEI